MRVCVYIDGFNFYYRRLKASRFKWTDFALLSKELLSDEDQIASLKYFTAGVSPRAGDAGAPDRQNRYFQALRTTPNLSIIKGKFQTKKILRPLVSNPECFVLVHDTEEKGSDVNLASHLLMDGFRDRYDGALVLSQDTDLLEPLRMVTEDLGKIAIVVWFDHSNPGKMHRKHASFIRHVTDSMLRRSQFPNPVIGRGGRKIWMPEEWQV